MLCIGFFCVVFGFQSKAGIEKGEVCLIWSMYHTKEIETLNRSAMMICSGVSMMRMVNGFFIRES